MNFTREDCIAIGVITFVLIGLPVIAALAIHFDLA